MKLSDRTIQVLKSFSGINPSILIRPGSSLETIAPTKKVLAKASVDETFDREFAIYDLSRFLGALSLFKEPELRFTDKYVSVESDGRLLNYTFAAPEMVVSPPKAGVNFPEPDVTFTLTARTLSEVLKAAGVLGMPEVVVRGDGTKVTVEAADVKNPTANVYKAEVGESDKAFRMVFKVEVMRFLPADYEVGISFKKIARFASEGATYFVVAEDASSVG